MPLSISPIRKVTARDAHSDWYHQYLIHRLLTSPNDISVIILIGFAEKNNNEPLMLVGVWFKAAAHRWFTTLNEWRHLLDSGGLQPLPLNLYIWKIPPLFPKPTTILRHAQQIRRPGSQADLTSSLPAAVITHLFMHSHTEQASKDGHSQHARTSSEDFPQTCNGEKQPK